MAAVTSGAELVKKLRESGTPDEPLAHARFCLSYAHQQEGRFASAADVIAALEEKLGPDHGTVRKAKLIAATGTWEQPVTARLPVEEQILAAEEKAAKQADEKPAEKPAKK